MLSFSPENPDRRTSDSAAPRDGAHRQRSGRLRSLAPYALVCLAGATVSPAAMADLSDTLHPFLQTSIAYDDNLLRQSEGAAGPLSDTYKSVDGGIEFDRTIGRQVLTGQATMTRVTFNRFEQLNYDGKDAKLDWNWHIANHLEGHLGATYSQNLAPYTDFHSDERNLRVQRKEYVDATWRFHPSWQVRAGYTQQDFDYELAAQSYNTHTEDTSELGFDYLASSGSRVGLQWRRIKGAYPDSQRIGDIVLDNGYTQDELKANIFWILSGVSRLQFLGGWERRKHNYFTSRDDSGNNGRLIYMWTPLGKTMFTGSVWREYAPYEGQFVNSALNKGASVAVNWTISAKLAAEGLVKHQTRAFEPIAGLTATDDLSDSTNTASVGLTYAPATKVKLELTGFHESRKGSASVGSNSYKSNGASLNATVQF